MEQSWILPGATASCCPAMAPPQCHFSGDGAPRPHSAPSLVSSKLLQSAQALIGLGQVSAIRFNQGTSTCQTIPSESLCVCADRGEGGSSMWFTHVTNKHIFSLISL